MRMRVNISSIHFDADQKLETFIEKKVNKLSMYYDSIIHADVCLKVNKSKDMADKLVEMKLGVSGKELVAHRQCKTFEEAAALSIEALKRQLLKYKEKPQTYS